MCGYSKLDSYKNDSLIITTELLATINNKIRALPEYLTNTLSTKYSIMSMNENQ